MEKVDLGRFRDGLEEARERYARAVANRNRFAHRYGVDLAEIIAELIAAHDARGLPG